MVVVVLGKIGEFARVFDARDRLGYSSRVRFLQGWISRRVAQLPKAA